jgi:ClpX C4-type zinc finger
VTGNLNRHSAVPPPAVACEPVLWYAVLDDSVGVNPGHGLLFVDGREIGRVPRLVICQAQSSSAVNLNYCADDWSRVGSSQHDTVSLAKERALRIYPGSSACWVEAHFTQQDVTRYLEESLGGLRCSFCGLRPDQSLAATFEGNGNVRICGACVAEFYEELNPGPGPQDSCQNPV